MLAFFTLGWPEILVVMGVILLLFGNRLPALARSMGSSIVEFKKGVREIDDSSTNEAATTKQNV